MSVLRRLVGETTNHHGSKEVCQLVKRRSVERYGSEGFAGSSSGIRAFHTEDGLLVFTMKDEQTAVFRAHQTSNLFFSNVLGLPKYKTRFALSIFPFIFKPLCILREM